MDTIPILLGGERYDSFVLSGIKSRLAMENSHQADATLELLQKPYSHTGEELLRHFADSYQCHITLRVDTTTFTYTCKDTPIRHRYLTLDLNKFKFYDDTPQRPEKSIMELLFTTGPYHNPTSQNLLDSRFETYFASPRARVTYTTGLEPAALFDDAVQRIEEYLSPLHHTLRKHEVAMFHVLLAHGVGTSKVLLAYKSIFEKYGSPRVETASSWARTRERKYKTMYKITSEETIEDSV